MRAARYVVVIHGNTRELPADWVLGWVFGIADERGETDRLSPLKLDGPQETTRVQALQLGHSLGWFDYQFVRRGDRS